MTELKTKKAINKKSEWTRRVVDNRGIGRIWYYRKKAVNEYGNEYLAEYYCYNCKAELIFKHQDPYDRDNQPYRVHKIFVKSLGKKDDDWKIGRESEYFKALCCKCWEKTCLWCAMEKGKHKGTCDNQATYNKCDCSEWLEKQLAATQHNLKIAQQKKDASNLVMESLANGIKLAKCEKDDKECGNYWVAYYLKDHIEKEQRNNDYLAESLQSEENNLKHLQELKEKWKEQYESNL